MKVDESNYRILEKASKMTGTDYDIIWRDAENIDGFIEADSLLSMVEDLIYEIDHLQEVIEDMERDIEDNYRPIPYKEQIGYNEKDFY